MEVDKPGTKKKSLISDSSEESESDLFEEPKAKKKHVVDSESEESEEMSDVENKEVEEKPKVLLKIFLRIVNFRDYLQISPEII